MPENIYKPVLTGDTPCQIPGLEWIYCGVFGLKRDGVFVEVGAFDGVSWSNTYFLAELGWAGVYVEPITRLANKCKEVHAKHPWVSVENCAIGNGSEVTIRQNGDTDYLFTGNPAFAKLNNATVESGHFLTVTLNNLLERHRIQYKFELLVIDVEGMEVEVLEGFTVEHWMPKMVIIETHELNPNAEMAERTSYINEYFHRAGYIKIYTSAINTIYIAPG